MKVTINASVNPAEDMTIYTEDGKRLKQPGNTIYSHFWDESDISKILNDKQLKELENGKFVFDIPSWQIKLLQGERAAKDNTELRFLMQWD